MIRKVSILLVLLLLSVSESGAQVLPFTHYTTDSELNALPSAEVTQVYQDRQGFIWFAIYSSGLVRYNGVKMEQYGTDDGLRDVTVWDMIEDPTGRLWASSNAGLVVTEKPLSFYKEGKRIKFISRFSEVPLVNVSVNHNRMVIDKAGWLWIGTESMGVVRYRIIKNEALESDTLSTSISVTESNRPVRSLTARQDGSVWVALLDGVLLKFKDGTFITEYHTGSEDNTNVLYETTNGILLGGEQGGRIWRMENDSNNTVFREVNTTSNSNIVDITSDSDGNIWISSEGSGLQKIVKGKNNEEVITYSRSNGLLSEIVFNVLEDREQNLWVAQSGGVSKLRYNYKAFANLPATSLAGEKPILPSPAINSVLPSDGLDDLKPCYIWAGSAEGGLACINKKFESEFISQADGLTGNWVNGLAYDSSGRLWIGTSRGLNSISFGDIQPIAGTKNEKSISVFGNTGLLAGYQAASILAINSLSMPLDDQNSKQIASLFLPAYQAVYVVVNDKLYTLDQSWDLPAVIYHAAAFDDKGHLWLGTRDQGIYRSTSPISLSVLSGGKIAERTVPLFQQLYSIENGFPTNQIDNLLWHEGKMWAGTPSGLMALSEEKRKPLQHITVNDGLSANNVTSMALSRVTKTFWAGTNQGLAEISPQTGAVLKKVTKRDGLIDNEVWFYGSVNITGDGAVYFGTAKGISIYLPLKDSQNDYPPIVYLSSAGSEENSGEHNEFTFEYAALSFGNERQVRYQTRLVGFNNEWSSASQEVRANYTNLPAYIFPKTYTFEARAVNESGLWSEKQLSYNFSVLPPNWLSWWAFLGYLSIFGMGVFFVDRIQRSRILKKERETALMRETELKAETAIARSEIAEAQAKTLKAENDLKTTELEKARELEKAYNELKSAQRRLIQSEKMASLGRLSTGIAHEIKNPLNFVNNFAELSKDLVKELKAAIEQDDRNEIAFITENLSFNTSKIEEHGKKADAIVQSMMHHSRGATANFEMKNPNDIIKQYAELAYHSKSSQKPGVEVSIITNLEEDLPHIPIISQQIGQVLQNVIENAFDAVCEKSLSENGSFHPRIEITTKSVDNKIEICIIDNGPGIPDEVHEKIFEPFFTTKPTGEGTGLGLSISYDIITQNHDGSIKVETLPEGGTSFIISLPIQEFAN